MNINTTFYFSNYNIKYDITTNLFKAGGKKSSDAVTQKRKRSKE